MIRFALGLRRVNSRISEFVRCEKTISTSSAWQWSRKFISRTKKLYLELILYLHSHLFSPSNKFYVTFLFLFKIFAFQCFIPQLDEDVEIVLLYAKAYQLFALLENTLLSWWNIQTDSYSWFKHCRILSRIIKIRSIFSTIVMKLEISHKGVENQTCYVHALEFFLGKLI